MNTHEIELYFPAVYDGERVIEEAYMTLTPCSFSTFTELSNFAHGEMKRHKACAVSFGPIVPRDETGTPILEESTPTKRKSCNQIPNKKQ